MTHRALVTGGSAGIGLAIAKKFRSLGYEVHVFDIAEEALKARCAEIGATGHVVNVADYAAVEAAVKSIQEKNGPIDILVNNAGITRDGFLHKMTRENWDLVMDVNLGSCFNTVRALVPTMRERGFGRIINISSMNGQRGQFGQTNYSAAKAGMIGLTKALAQEVAAKGITVNVVSPGFILTEMTGAMPADVLKTEVAKIPAGRIGQPDDIANMVVYLASDMAGFITGATMSVNGGQYMI
ncbi:MAG: beta-ketoacyl-ACP reductase [Alphaproteobacteria bacterium]|nr:beta-ketoacyl-ACP reductase [Alphaproteobacteria bacterium]